MPHVLPRISAAWLRERGACATHLKLFEETFGERARVTPTRANLRKAAEAGLAFDWLIGELEGPPYRLIGGHKVYLILREGEDAARTEARALAGAIAQCRATISNCVGLIHSGSSLETLTLVRRINDRNLDRMRTLLEQAAASRESITRPYRLRAADALADALGLPFGRPGPTSTHPEP